MSEKSKDPYLLAVSGSASIHSSNTQLLRSIQTSFPEYSIQVHPALTTLPLFQTDEENKHTHEALTNWKNSVEQAKAIIISSPEYLHSIPAVLKNALEWCTHSGCFFHKPVLLISFTPNPPRGEKMRTHLSEVLKALEARCVATLDLYRNELEENDGKFVFNEIQTELIKESLKLL